MARALELAVRGIGTTSPNPRVGAVIVKAGKIIAEGWHKKAGSDHAEIVALKKIGRNAAGATMYITLEPCSTQGRTPPCTEAIIDSGMKRVVVAMTDPNPSHRGRGMRLLRRHGIETTCGILRTEAAKLNSGFVKFHTEGLPHVLAKAAISLDGKIATVTGDSKWITNEKARKHAHRLREESDAVVVGVSTVVKDDPMLTVRCGPRQKNHPRRVIVDSLARISLSATVLKPDLACGTTIAVTRRAPESKIEKIRRRGAEVMICNSKKGRVDLSDLMRRLAREGFLYILIEGGSAILTTAFEEGLVDEVAFFYAPMIIGGETAPTLVGGRGIKKIIQALRIKNVDIETLDDNVLIRGLVRKAG